MSRFLSAHSNLPKPLEPPKGALGLPQPSPGQKNPKAKARWRESMVKKIILLAII
jgi:hypothetical protein